MNLWYITVLVITTLSPPEGYMQYTQGFKDEASCQAFLNKYLKIILYMISPCFIFCPLF